MIYSTFKRTGRWLIFLSLIVAMLYGTSRVYYYLTDGFTTGNIYSELPVERYWNTRLPDDEENKELQAALQQPFTYLGKGCQSYVFASQDGRYVIKFIKHQRFRTKPWLDALAWVPGVDNYYHKRQAHKASKYYRLLEGWKTAFDHLAAETAVVGVHINTTQDSEPHLTLADKMGYQHVVDLNQCEYLVQRRAIPLQPVLEDLIAQNDDQSAKKLLDQLIALVLNLYQNGFADEDHALMQNTGLLNGVPIPIDVGQLTMNPEAATPAYYRQALFNKTYRLRTWLEGRSPTLHQYLELRLLEILGEDLYTLRPHFTV